MIFLLLHLLKNLPVHGWDAHKNGAIKSPIGFRHQLDHAIGGKLVQHHDVGSGKKCRMEGKAQSMNMKQGHHVKASITIT